MEVHHTQERLEQAEHAHHQGGKAGKRTALIIIILAVGLALIEMAGKEAQFASIEHNINVSDLYAFYQAKTIRGEILHAAVASAEVLAADPGDRVGPRNEQVDTWKKAIERLDTEPSTGQGRKELLERAKVLEGVRDRESQSYHQLEIGSAALQLAIVIASAAVITEVMLLELVSVVLGIVGCLIAIVGWMAPQLLAW